MFDIGNVLIRWDDRTAFRRIARRYGLPYGTVQERLMQLRPGLQSGRLSLHEFWTRFARSMGVEVPHDWRTAWADEMARGARFRPDVAGLAAELRRAGVRTALFSNTDASHWRLFASRGWVRGFSPALPSFRLRAVKPRPAAFRAAHRRLPAHSGPPIFVDDQPANVEAARRFGWDAIRFTSIPALRRALRRRGLLPSAGRGRKGEP